MKTIHQDNFAETLLIAQQTYHNMYPGEPTEAIGWLYNNILSHMNNYQPSLTGFTVPFMRFINRGEQTKITNMDIYLRELDKLSCEAAVMKLWDKMLPEERQQFVRRWTIN